MKFSKLQEERDARRDNGEAATSSTMASTASLASPGRTSPAPAPASSTVASSCLESFLSTNRVTKLGIACLVLLMFVAVLMINTRITSYNNFIQVSDHLNATAKSQESLRSELQLVGEKLNTIKSDIDRIKSNRTLLRLKSVVQPELDAVEAKIRVLVNENKAAIENAQKSVGLHENVLQNISAALSQVKNQTSIEYQLIHDKIDRTRNSSRDFSIATGQKNENLNDRLDELRHLLENAEEAADDFRLRQLMKNLDTDKKIRLVEEALKNTVNEFNITSNGHAEFANKTMRLLDSVMDLYRKETEAENTTSPGDSTIDGVTIEEEITTEASAGGNSPAPVECNDPKTVPGNMIVCSASSTYSRKYSCEKAFDGVLQTNRLGSAWASRGQGVGAWIEANFTKPVIIKEIKVLQRFVEAEANKQIEIKFDGDIAQKAELPAKGSKHWNVIKLSRGVPASSLRITIVEVYGTINNGFKEISISGCF